ncbi:MAG: hypothetical protein QM726_00530 [Chitinophagaceae bacterium]
MKVFYLINCFLLAVLVCNAQIPTDVKNPSLAYLYENFTEGRVLMKSGAVEKAMLNYNTSDQSVVFKQDDKVMTLTGLTDIDTIYFNNKKFIPGPDELIYEVIANSNLAVSLYVTYTNKLKPALAVTDQANGTTRKDAGEASNTLTSAYVTRPYKDDYTVEIRKNYWLIKGKQINKALNAKNFEKVFPHKEEAINNFIAKNEINFNIEPDLIKLTQFCNSLK